MSSIQIMQLVLIALRSAPEVIRLFVGLIQIFTDDENDLKIQTGAEKAIGKLNDALGWGRTAAREIQELDFGQGIEGNKNARYFELVERLKTTAAAVGETLGETDARTIAQNSVKLERLEDRIAIPQGG